MWINVYINVLEPYKKNMKAFFSNSLLHSAVLPKAKFMFSSDVEPVCFLCSHMRAHVLSTKLLKKTCASFREMIIYIFAIVN